MKRTIFIILAVAAVAFGMVAGFFQASRENEAAAGVVATENARWVEWTSQTPGPLTGRPGPEATPHTLNCPPPTAEGYRIFCLIVEPEEAAALATAAAVGMATRATAEIQEPTP